MRFKLSDPVLGLLIYKASFLGMPLKLLHLQHVLVFKLSVFFLNSDHLLVQIVVLLDKLFILLTERLDLKVKSCKGMGEYLRSGLHHSA